MACALRLHKLELMRKNSEKAIASLVNGGYMSASEACLTFGLAAEQLNDILSVASGVISTHRTDMASWQMKLISFDRNKMV